MSRMPLVLGLIVLSGTLSAPGAAADDCLHAMGGPWASAPESPVKVRLSVAGEHAVRLEVDGAPLEITQRNVSPDKQTTFVTWEGGEGAFVCEADGQVSVSLFDRRIPARKVNLVRAN